ncbi:chromate efflux transporter [Brevundimonas sp.]|uniref:chromate efflux transporter n=1 Tax=Brevundimonas sp. TaxID=1871086 RepID=UPI002ABA7A9D|nr:chromate efflux transporter [Brevundimonas sp.]MDZ4364580.1 chromate efflux transporter [Brevundimonas sp.]
MPTPTDDLRPPTLSHGQLFLKFLRFGLLAFGGPVAQIAMIRRELVERERWLSGPGFNRLLAVMQILPGPEAHELCVHLGIRAKGRIGGLLAGLGFMLPGFVLMMALASAYVAFAPSRDLLAGAFLGIQIAVIAIIVRAVHRIGLHVLEDRALWAIALSAVAASLLGISFWVILVAAAVVYPLVRNERWIGVILAVAVALGTAFALAKLPGGERLTVADPVAVAGPLALLWTGLKAGLLTFGGAYTAIPYVRADTVGRGWLSDGTFLDGVAFAGVLPAPLVIFCTFVGYVVGGWMGAVAITVGVFLPAFAFSIIFYEHLDGVADNPRLHRVLAGVAAAVVGIIAATTLDLASATAAKVPPVPLAMVAAAVLFVTALFITVKWKSRFSAPVIVVAAGVAGQLAFG